MDEEECKILTIFNYRLRVLGGTRFTIWSLARLIGLRSYKGKLWYLPSTTRPHDTNGAFKSPVNRGSNLDLPSEFNLETEEGMGI